MPSPRVPCSSSANITCICWKTLRIKPNQMLIYSKVWEERWLLYLSGAAERLVNGLDRSSCGESTDCFNRPINNHNQGLQDFNHKLIWLLVLSICTSQALNLCNKARKKNTIRMLAAVSYLNPLHQIIILELNVDLDSARLTSSSKFIICLQDILEFIIWTASVLTKARDLRERETNRG